MYVTEKACKRVALPLDLAKVVNCRKVSDVGMEVFESDCEFQETLVSCELGFTKNELGNSYPLRFL